MSSSQVSGFWPAGQLVAFGHPEDGRVRDRLAQRTRQRFMSLSEVLPYMMRSTMSLDEGPFNNFVLSIQDSKNPLEVLRRAGEARLTLRRFSVEHFSGSNIPDRLNKLNQSVLEAAEWAGPRDLASFASFDFARLLKRARDVGQLYPSFLYSMANDLYVAVEHDARVEVACLVFELECELEKVVSHNQQPVSRAVKGLNEMIEDLIQRLDQSLARDLVLN